MPSFMIKESKSEGEELGENDSISMRKCVIVISRMQNQALVAYAEKKF